MRACPLFRAFLTTALCLIGSTAAFAQSPAAAQDVSSEAIRQEIDALKRDFEARLSALEGRLKSLEASGSSVPAIAPAPPAAGVGPSGQTAADAPASPPGASPVLGSAVGGGKVFNPDIAVIGDFLGAAGKNSVNPGRALELHESEASFQAVVDPYARADFFISFGEDSVNIEEGFLTFTELPGGLLTKVGKMRAAFGKVNTLHNHILPWADRPLVINNLVGGEDGISDAGISVARLIPNPWFFLEATGQVFRGDSGEDLYRTSRRGDLSYVGHVRGYQDLGEASNIDLGLSYSRGHNGAGIVNNVDVGRFTTSLFGVDATFRWRPLQRSIYHSFIGRSELIWSHRDAFGGLQQAMGYYVSGDYQFARRWFTGIRYDRSDHADNASLSDTGQSLVLTYWPSEFSQVRGQYRRTKYAVGPGDNVANEFLFQVQFAIGAHGAHPF